MDTYKNQLVNEHIYPFFAEGNLNDERLREDLCMFYTLNKVAPHQFLQLPGSFREGKMWFSISATVHSYYLGQNGKKQRGRQIWQKLNFILDCESLLDQTSQTDYVEALEEGYFLSIRFSELLILMERYSSVKSRIEELAKMQREYYREHYRLLQETPENRIEQLLNNQKVFVACSSQEIQAMHVHMSVRSYRDHLHNLKSKTCG